MDRYWEEIVYIDEMSLLCILAMYRAAFCIRVARQPVFENGWEAAAQYNTIGPISQAQRGGEVSE